MRTLIGGHQYARVLGYMIQRVFVACKEARNGSLWFKKAFGATSDAIRLFSHKTDTRAKLESLISCKPLVVFMKGTPAAPQCGFSRAVCQMLELHGAIPYMTLVNVLEDQDARDTVKKITEWPTIPQVFVGGSFVGGCDLVMEMHRNGELEKLLAKHVLVDRSDE